MKTIVNFTKVNRIGVMQWPRVLGLSDFQRESMLNGCVGWLCC